MKNTFSSAFEKESRWTKTLNEANALNTTGNGLLDFFATVGALRNADSGRIETLFEEAYKEDPLRAIKIIFYTRDAREGLGERDSFRTLLNYAAKKYPESISGNIHLIGHYGRFDDLYALIGTPLEDEMWKYMKTLFISDLYCMKNEEPCSLLAKWIKTPDASSDATRKLGILTAKKLGYSVYDFKRILRKLRAYIKVVEAKMSTNRWTEIDYEAVPSKAMLLYKNAFKRHDKDGFDKYMAAVSKGEAKINASTLYPYDIVRSMFGGCYEGRDVLEAQWKALPNYVEPGTNAIVMADVSGSMCCCDCLPMFSSIALALYFAERNVGAYEGLFMTFSSNPTVVKVKGNTLEQKLRFIKKAEWGQSTNFEAAFKKILDIAVKGHVPPEEMVKSLIVISDMEFDAANGARYNYHDRSFEPHWSFYDLMKAEFEAHGYEIPNIIFWNVNSHQEVFHADSEHKGVQLVSGHSASTFKQLMDSVGMTPVELMLKVIDSDRYRAITLGSAIPDEVVIGVGVDRDGQRYKFVRDRS